jgi:hypothetical protein
MLSDTKPTAAEMRVMRAEAERVRTDLSEQESALVIELPQLISVMAVAS